MEAEFQVTGAWGQLTASLSCPRTCGDCHPPCSGQLQVSWVSPVSHSLHPVFVTVLSKAATLLSGAPDHPVSKKKDNWAIFCLKQKKTNLVWFFFKYLQITILVNTLFKIKI